MSHDYFALFGLAPSFRLDKLALQKAYIALQQRYHPDRLIGQSHAERAKAVQISMDATEGYETLKSPLRRAEHLLALQGIIVNSDEHDTHHASQDILMEMLEIRESLAEAQSEIDIAKQTQDIKAAMSAAESQLAESFAAEQWEKAAQQTIRFRYLGKALEEAMGYHYRLKAV